MTNGTAASPTDKPLIDRTTGARNVRRLLVLCGAVFFLAAFPALLGHSYGGKLLLAIFALLAIVGVVVVFAAALGLVSVAGQPGQGSIANDFLDTLDVGTLIVDRRGRIVYANTRLWHDHGGRARSGGDCGRSSGCSRASATPPKRSTGSPIWRATIAAGRRRFRLPRSLADAGDHRAALVPRLRAPAGRRLPTALQAWQIADVTAERDDQETFFQDLQHAIDYLDHAPAGFFAADAEGRIAYINATLADWLGVDLVSFRPYARAIGEFAADGDAALLSTSAGAADPDAVSVVDLDLVRAATAPAARPAPAQDRPSAGRRAGPVAHHRPPAQPRRDGRRRARCRRGPLHALLQFLADGDRRARTRTAASCAPTPPSRACSARAGGRRPALGRRGRARRKPRRAAPGAALAAGRQEAGIPVVDVELRRRAGPLASASLYQRRRRQPATARATPRSSTASTSPTSASLEEQFAKSQKMQAVGNLAGGIAHDFNNVLTIITASVDFLLLNHRSGDPSFQDLLLIKQSANRAASLVRQLLAYSRRQTMRPKMLNLTDVIADMHLLLKRISGDLVKLERHHARDLWPVMADIGQFEQVITNLVQNARDAMPDGGRIHDLDPQRRRRRGARASAMREMHERRPCPGRGHRTPAPACRPTSPSGSSSPSSPPRRSARAPASACPWSTASSSSPAASSSSIPSSGKGTTFRIFLPRHIPLDAAGRQGRAEPFGRAGGGQGRSVRHRRRSSSSRTRTTCAPAMCGR